MCRGLSAVRQALSAYLDVHPQRDNSKAKLWQGQRAICKTAARDVALARLCPTGTDCMFCDMCCVTPLPRVYLAANPSDLRGLAALLGHASLNTVMIHTSASLEDLAERMERG